MVKRQNLSHSYIPLLSQPQTGPTSLEMGASVGPNPKRKKLDGVTLPSFMPDVSLPSNVILPTNPLVVMNNEAICLYKGGDVVSASHLFEEAATIAPYRASSGGQSSAAQAPTIIEPSKTSYMYQRMEFDEGMRVYSEAEYLNAGEHPLVLESLIMFNAGQARTSLGDFVSAARFYSLSLQNITENTDPYAVIPPIPLDRIRKVSIPILHNLGQLAYRDGQLSRALTFYEAALNHARQTHGENHVSVGLTLNCMGVVQYHSSAEGGSRALVCFENALKILEPTLPSVSSTIATLLNNIGRVHVQNENYAAALNHYERSLEIRRTTLGEDHVDYAATAFNAGQSLHHLGQHDQAIKLYEEFLRVALQRFSKDHRDIAVVLGSIAQIHQERKEYEKSLPLYKESLRVARVALGSNHAEVAMILNRIGNFHFEREDLVQALEAYKTGYDIEELVLGRTHPNKIVTLSNIGEVYRQQNQYKDALSYYTRAMELQKERFGPGSAEVAGALNVIGLIHDQTGRPELALQSLQEALVIRRTVLGDEHIDVAATLAYLGTIFYRRNMLNMALRLFTESLRIRQSKLGKDHQDVSFTLYNVGLCHHLLGNSQEAIECLTETLRIERQILGNDHKDVALTLLKLADALKGAGEHQRALSCFQETLKVGNLRPSTIARAHNEIANILLVRGDVEGTMKAYVASARSFRKAGRDIDSVRVSPAIKIHRANFGEGAPVA